MKNKILFVAVLAALALVTMTNNVNARSWRINNNTTRRANFVDINAACASDEVTDGDTLYLDPGCNLTSEQTVTKRLTIVGTGFFFTDQPYAVASMTSILNLKAEGIKVTGLQSSNDIYIYADNITIERCNVKSITWKDQGQYIVIRQCYLRFINGYNDYRTLGCTIENNFILGDPTSGGGAASVFPIKNFYSSTIRYNLLKNTVWGNGHRWYVLTGIKNCSFTNNIIYMIDEYRHNNLFENCTNCQVTNNLLSCDEGVYPEYPNNTRLGTHELTGIFTCSGVNDHYYEMTEDSPAKAIEAGAFYGSHPYVFSGLPYGHPYYTSVNVSPRAKDGKIHITLNSKVQDE